MLKSNRRGRRGHVIFVIMNSPCPPFFFSLQTRTDDQCVFVFEDNHDPDVSTQSIYATLSVILGGGQRLNTHQGLPEISLLPPNKRGGLQLYKSLE